MWLVQLSVTLRGINERLLFTNQIKDFYNFTSLHKLNNFSVHHQTKDFVTILISQDLTNIKILWICRTLTGTTIIWNFDKYILQLSKIHFAISGFDKQMDVVNLYDLAGHSPACFWIGGYESDSVNNVNSYLSLAISCYHFHLHCRFYNIDFITSKCSLQMFSWNVSGNPMEQYFTEWESGYPKNRWKKLLAFCLALLSTLLPPECCTQDLPALGFAV